MKKYKCDVLNLDKFIHQNKAEIIDSVEGSLIDNYLLATKRGFIGLFETYCTCWTSNYTLIFSKDLAPLQEQFNKLERDIEECR